MTTIHPVKNILEADGIELQFDVRKILSGVYLRCEQGQIVGFLGRNGSGKSCLLKIIFGSMRAETKSVRINGKYLTGGMQGRRISYLPQEQLIPPNIKLGTALKLFQIPADVVLAEIPEAREWLTFYPDQISGGMLRIFEVMLILFSNSEFSLLDEPFSGLSPIAIEHVTSVIQKVKEKKGIVITDHLHRSITSASDKLYIVANGYTRAVKSLEDLVTFGYVSSLD